MQAAGEWITAACEGKGRRRLPVSAQRACEMQGVCRQPGSEGGVAVMLFGQVHAGCELRGVQGMQAAAGSTWPREQPVQAGQTQKAAGFRSLLRTAVLKADLWLHRLQSPCQRWWWRAAAAPRCCLPVWPAGGSSCMEEANWNGQHFTEEGDSEPGQLALQLC